MVNQLAAFLLRIQHRLSRVALDASKHPAEQYYATIYLEEFSKRMAETGGQGLSVLEAGCGTGRLMIPIAQMGYRVTGIDNHHDSLNVARSNLDSAGVRAQLIEADLVKALAGLDDASFDAAMAIESIYVNEQYETILDHLARIVRPGGLLFITHKTRFFYLTRAMAMKHYDDLEYVAGHNSGRLRKGMHRTYYNWQTRSQIEATYIARALDLLSLHAIGVCSGFGDDPLASLCDPGTLNEDQQRVLREVETCDDDLLMTGRYVLAVVRKPAD